MALLNRVFMGMNMTSHARCIDACRVEELLELKEQLQKQLDTATAQLKKSEADLAEIRRQGEELKAKLEAAEGAKEAAEKVPSARHSPCSVVGGFRAKAC